MQTNLATTAADLNTSDSQLFISHIIEVFDCDAFWYVFCTFNA